MAGGSQLPSFGPLMLAMLTGTHRLHWMNWQKRKRKGYLIAQHEKHLALTLLRGLIALMLGWGNVNPRLEPVLKAYAL